VTGQRDQSACSDLGQSGIGAVVVNRLNHDRAAR
jgi:hypothetical protein